MRVLPTGKDSVKKLLKQYQSEAEALHERKRLLPTGQKSTNIEVQIDKTIEHYMKKINSIKRLGW